MCGLYLLQQDCGAKDVALTKSTAEAAELKKELDKISAELADKQKEVADLAAQLKAAQGTSAQKLSGA